MQPLLIAHRGDSAHAPENTLAAFEQAIDKGTDWIELDLQPSLDDEIFVFHDRDLSRLVGRPGRAAAHSLAELGTMPVLPERYGKGLRNRIPALRTILGSIGNQVPLYLEMKGEGDGLAAPRNRVLLEGCLALVGADSPHALASFDSDLVRAVLAAGRRGVLIAEDFHSYEELPPSERRALFALSLRHNHIDIGIAERLRRAGVPLWAWTVDRAEELEPLLALKVSAICSNDVARMRRMLERRAER